jgi:hypothetical protein
VRINATLWVSGIVLAVCASNGGCALDSHDNFREVNQRHVGRRDDNPWYWRNRYPEMRVGAKPLPNGNIEEQFAWNPRCQVYFEIDKASHVILGWRFEGSRQDCYLRP